MDLLIFAEAEKRRILRNFLARPGQEHPPAVLAGSLCQSADRQQESAIWANAPKLRQTGGSRAANKLMLRKTWLKTPGFGPANDPEIEVSSCSEIPGKL